MKETSFSLNFYLNFQMMC